METKDGRIGIIAAEESEEKITPAKLEAMLHRQGKRCYYTGEQLTPQNVSLDHRQPLSKGGAHCLSNVVLCTKDVNRMKGQRTEADFISTCMAVASYVPGL